LGADVGHAGIVAALQALKPLALRIFPVLPVPWLLAAPLGAPALPFAAAAPAPVFAPAAPLAPAPPWAPAAPLAPALAV
jgi:hypothetical protein